MKRRVVTHPRADRDVAKIYAWLAQHSIAGSNAWYRAYRKAVEQLCEMPDHCALAAETALVSLDVRQILFKTRRGLKYRILFDIQGGSSRSSRPRSWPAASSPARRAVESAFGVWLSSREDPVRTGWILSASPRRRNWQCQTWQRN
jgi:plasmid stabilization system protein ParE